MKKVYIVDGFSYIFRAFYAVAPLTTSKGFPTNALYGFTKMILKLLKETDSDHLFMAMDSEKNFRYELYPEYKANRGECPEDLKPQLPLFEEIVKSLGVPVLSLDNYEADDVIGTLVTKLKQDSEMEVVIVTADKDLMQLVNNRVSIWDTMRDKKYKSDEVKEKLGVFPEKVIDYLALVGDSSDNIPGLKGVGPKTAITLLDEYKDLEGVIKSKEEIGENKSIRGRKNIQKELMENEDKLRLSKELVTIVCNAPMNIEDKDIKTLTAEDVFISSKRKEINQEKLNELIEHLEFSSLFKGFYINNKKKEQNFDYITVLDKEIGGFLGKLKEQTFLSIDTETTSLNPYEAELVGMSFCFDRDTAYYVPLGHQNLPEQTDLKRFITSLKEILKDKKLIGQNLKYDLLVLKEQGLDLENVYFDTLIAAYLLEPDGGNYSLTKLARKYLSLEASEYKEVVGDKENFSFVEIEPATEYAAEDAHFCFLLKDILEKDLKEEDLLGVFYDIEIPLVNVLVDIESTGFKLDIDFLEKISLDFSKELEQIKSSIFLESGEEFNINSPKQLQEILFNKLQIPTKGLKRTKTGISTNQSVLERLSRDYGIADLILRYRTLTKLKSTYADALPKSVSAKTNRVHTSLNQTITATGRLSSSNPNLQNIPIQSESGHKIRQAFISEKGSSLIAADYSQIELRVLAHLSKDEKLIEAFVNDEDIHSKTARELFNIPIEEEVSPTYRRYGKTLNFGIIYGMGGFRLSRELEMPIGEANKYIENYFDTYSGVASYFSKLKKQAKEKGYVETLFKRRRYLSNIDVSGRGAGFLDRVAINAPIQGTAADVIKLAMIKLYEKIKGNSELKMLLQVHDELVFECKKDLLSEYTSLIKEVMEGVVKLDIPLKVDLGVGANWREAHG